MTEETKENLKEKLITKTMRYEIIKPTNCAWEEFGKVLNDLRYKSAHIGNYMIQLLWQWDNHRQQIKIETGSYPDSKEQPNYYMLLRERFPDVGADIINQTRQWVANKYQKDRKEIFSLKKSITSFRDNMPICVYNRAYIIRDLDNNWEIDARLLPSDAPQNRFSFIVKTGEKSKKVILERINSGEYKQGMMQIVRDKKKKWYAVLSYSFEPKTREYKGDRIMHVTFLEDFVGVKIGVDGTKLNHEIPCQNIEQTLSQFNARLEKLRNQKRYGGQDLTTKIQKIQDTCSNWKSTENHKLSKTIVQKAIRLNCSEIFVEGDKWFTDWNLFDLKNKIKYKAMETGINYL